MKETNSEALIRALAILREVTQKLAQGVDKEEFEQEYRLKYVSPGISVQRHVQELRIFGSLVETNTTMKLKSKHVTAAT